MDSILDGKTECEEVCEDQRAGSSFLGGLEKKKKNSEKWFGCGTSNLSAVKNLVSCGCVNVQLDGALPNCC